MDVARSAPQGAHYDLANVIYLLPLLGMKKGAYGTLSMAYTNSAPDQ